MVKYLKLIYLNIDLVNKTLMYVDVLLFLKKWINKDFLKKYMYFHIL